jgi:hypothetical protein
MILFFPLLKFSILSEIVSPTRPIRIANETKPPRVIMNDAKRDPKPPSPE